MSAEDLNVGRVDAWIRRAVALPLAIGTLWLVARIDLDWALTVLLFPFILVAYLLLTASARIDLVYRLAGWKTTRQGRTLPRLRSPRSRGRPRTSP